MSALINRTAKSAKAKSLMTLLGVFAALGAASLAVYAAKARPDFKLGASPSARTVNQGQAAIYSLSINRTHGFKGAIKFSASGLPRSAKAVWKQTNGKGLKVKKGVVTLPADKKAAVLFVQTTTTTPIGATNPKVVAKSGKKSHSKKLKLTVNAAQLPPGNTAGGGTETGTNTGTNTGNTGGTGGNTGGGTTTQAGTVAVDASTPQTVVETDAVDIPITINRGNGFTGPVDLTVTGLPAGTTFSITPNPATGSTATLRIDSGSAGDGDYPFSVTATGSSNGQAISGSKPMTLSVQQKQPFSISGSPTGEFSPGVSKSLDLTLNNPNTVDLKITDLNVSVDIDQAHKDAGCDLATNYGVTQIPDSDFTSADRVVAAGQTKTLSQLGITAPQVEMHETNTNQDACKGAALNLNYSGTATK
jgi:hypothetical protein